jgi:hypothetical protein
VEDAQRGDPRQVFARKTCREGNAAPATGEATEPLRCVECDRVQTDPVARGWRAYLTVDEDEPAEAIVYCPECAEREFGVNLLDDGG